MSGPAGSAPVELCAACSRVLSECPRPNARPLRVRPHTRVAEAIRDTHLSNAFVAQDGKMDLPRSLLLFATVAAAAQPAEAHRPGARRVLNHCACRERPGTHKLDVS